MANLLMLLILCTACGHAVTEEDAPDLQAVRVLEGGQLGGPTPLGICECGTGCTAFGIDRGIVPPPPLTLRSSYDFGVTMTKTSDCPAILELPEIYGQHCEVSKQLRFVELDLTAMGLVGTRPVDRFDVYSEADGVPNPFLWTNATRNRIYSDRDCVLYFRWRQAWSGNPDLTLQEVRGGGICIIGIMTEPHFPPSNWGGEWPDRLDRLPNSPN